MAVIYSFILHGTMTQPRGVMTDGSNSGVVT